MREFPLATVLTARDNASPKIKGLTQSAERMGERLGRVGRSLSLKVTAPVAAMGFSVGRTVAGFEQSINTIEGLTGAAGDRLDALSAKARELGKTTQFSATEVADAMTFLARSGFSDSKILAAIEPNLNLAAAGQLGLAEASDISSDILSTFGKEAEATGGIVDALAHAAATSNTTVQQMGHGIQFAGSAAMSAGVSFEETVGLMTVLANQGQRGEKAGTGLRGAILALVDPSAKAQRALMRLGISQRDLLDDEGKIRSLTGTLQKMHAAGATTTDIFSIFGQRPGGIVASLFTELKKGPNALGEAVSSIENDSLGAAQRLAEINMKGLTGAVRSLISRWDEFKLAVGDAGVTASLTAIVNWLGSLATKAAELPAPVLMVGSGLLGLAATVGPLLVGIGMTAKGFAIAKTGALLTKGAIVGLARSIAVGALLRVNALALGAGKLATVLTGRVFPALVRVGAAMLANPIGIAVAGVGGLIAAGVALYRNWDRVAGFFGGIWARIKSAFGDGLAWITSKLQGTTLGRVLSFLGLDVGSGEPAIATAPAIDTTRVASAVAPRAGQDGRARVEIDVRGGREAVAVRATEIDDVELDLSQGIALGGIG